MEQRQQLEQALAALETQRAVLGDTAVDAAQAGLRQKLAELDQATTISAGAENTGDAGEIEVDVYAGDHRPNNGLREGTISHQEVNQEICAREKSVIFGQQTRLRSGRRLHDKKLHRLHAGHRMSKFFYGAVRQLPGRIVDALLEKNISVTLVHGPDLLVFHNVREHQAFHLGRTRKTLYLPQAVLQQAFEKGYDYWALTEVLIQETWPLLDYLLILELVNRCQYHLRSHYTLGYHFIKDNLREINKHRHDSDAEEDEFGIFFRHYAAQFFALGADIVQREPYDLTDEIYDEVQERFWSREKLGDISQAYNFPSYFLIDRDIVHPAAFKRASETGQSLSPQTPAEVMHDLWDESRFNISRTIRAEDLLEQLLEIGAPAIQTFIRTVAEGQVMGAHYGSINRFGIHEYFKQVLQGYSSTRNANLPGCLGYDFFRLYEYYLQVARCDSFEKFRDLPSEDQKQGTTAFKETLLHAVELQIRPDRVVDFKSRIESSSNTSYLLEAAEGLLHRPLPEIEAEHICGLLAKLDRHPLYHSTFLEQYRQISGNDEVILAENIQPEVQRLSYYVPERPVTSSSDPQGLSLRLRKFKELQQHDPNSKRQFTFLASVLIRLDGAENYDQLCEVVADIGDYALPAAMEILRNEEQFNDELRTSIRDAARRVGKMLST